MTDISPQLTAASNPSYKVTDDAVVKALARLVDASSTLRFTHSLIDAARKNAVDGIVTIDDIMAPVSCMERYWADAMESLGVPSIVQRDIKNRHQDLRKANMTIHELTEKLGKEVTPEHIQCGIGRAEELVREWWESCGFDHVAEFTASKYSCFAELSLMSSNVRKLERAEENAHLSHNDISELWNRQMKEKGFIIVPEEEAAGRDGCILSCDQNNALLRSMLTKRFPNADIMKTETTTMYRDRSNMRLYKMRVRLPLTDILAVPEEPQEAV